MAVCLAAVVSGDAYVRYAEQLADSAAEYFHPDGDVGFLCLEGREGWPAATMYRYHVLLEQRRQLERFDHVFLVDADMRFEAPVGGEVLGRMVGTLHPGYVRKPASALPLERRADSEAFVRKQRGNVYYCGGFVGGETRTFLAVASSIKAGVDLDARKGLTAVWHDESHLNAALNFRAPDVVLPPSYCYPDDDSNYVTWWPQPYERILVALDKPEHERRGR